MITPIHGSITTPGNTDTGIIFYQDGNQIYILDISAGSPFAHTRLRSGMLVISVNNIPCEGQTSESVSDILNKVTGNITILAHHDSSTMTPLEPVWVDNQLPTAPVVPDPVPVTAVLASPVPVIQNASVVQPQVSNVDQTNANQQPQTAGNHPPGVDGGGVWGTVTFIGGNTLLCVAASFLCFWPGLFVFCCPIDERRAYCVNGSVSHNHTTVCLSCRFYAK